MGGQGPHNYVYDGGAVGKVGEVQSALKAQFRATGKGQVPAYEIRETMRPLAEGGLGVIDFKTMQKALNMYWIQAYLQSGCGKGCITAKLTSLS
ncbi:hypothetical protein BO83DRAFT_432288 [Aspergillus eucalypticola CBS 122712]|uniref:Uncharacterized protein n=1 Tax=Aspergillus eucalypticola (strain CBS 122712 / IBT 29274) TaxID=1448314 RepID=A0A317ULM2_ASPEC|nr:uncharacterized protein BO83DRAFT_432288 [Aspergillus eucalypticola CBS 122712]PWY62601.1 hypothetical protein BO83DRAFT_432288 [Aspergillus eucalypticola CBS 122712]